MKNMPRVVADIDKDLKRWLQIYALDNETTMSEVIANLIQDHRDRVEGEVENTPSKAKK